MKRKISIIASLLLSSSVVFAGGFQVNMQGVRQVAMGGSSTALAYDIASIFYNPGALAKTAKGTQVYLSANGIFAKTTFVSTPTAGYTSQTDNPMSTPFNLYLSHKLNDKIALGFGVYTPFGSTVNWGNTNANSLRYLIEKIELRNINFQPTISYQVNDKVSIGGVILLDNYGHTNGDTDSVDRFFKEINAKVKRTEHFGTLEWDGFDTRRLTLNDISETAKIKVGDSIITGGMSLIFPEGINIGTVSKIISQNETYSDSKFRAIKISVRDESIIDLDIKENYLRIEVKLHNDMSNLNNVYIIESFNKKEFQKLKK